VNADVAPPLVASRSVALRPFTLADAPKIHAMSQETSLRTWLPDQVYASEARAREVLAHLIDKCRDPGTPVLAPYVLGVYLRSSMALIGHVGLSPLGAGVEVGYAIEEKQQGRGFGSEAVGIMVDWALRRFDLPRVLGIVAEANLASYRVLENAGFVLAGEEMARLHGRLGRVRTYERTRPTGAER
jgi:ribosomal-protein-alanine N-acetyltransferase